MIISCKKNVCAKSTTQENIEDVIHRIRNGSHKETTDEIRRQPSKELRDDLKRKLLPQFIPCVLFDKGVTTIGDCSHPKATGIFQYDIDDYDEIKSTKLINKLRKLPCVIYAFLSPSYGVKFGVMTDFQCTNKNDMPKKYKIGHGIVTEELRGILTEITKNDKATESLVLACFLSHDPDAYFNVTCDELALNDRIDALYDEAEAKRKEHTQSASLLVPVVSDKEVKHALTFIPDYLRFPERRQVNFAVIDHFGDRAFSVLYDHWQGVKDKKKLARQIKSQIRSANGDVKVSTLFHIAKAYGYTYSGETGINDTCLPPTYNFDINTPDECSKLLNNYISQDFFSEKKNKALLVEAGAGKTKTACEAAVYHLSHNRSEQLAIFVKTYELADQLVQDINETMCALNKELTEKTGKAFPPDKGIKWHQRPIVIKGIGQHCKRLDKTPAQAYGSKMCKGCIHRDKIIGTCEYHKQFKAYNRVRIYHHNRLFIKPYNDKNLRPDHIIIDEDITSLMVDKEFALLRIQETQYHSISCILEAIEDGMDLTQAAIKYHDKLLNDYDKINTKSNRISAQVKQCDFQKTQSETDIKEYSKLQKKIIKNEKYKAMFIELIDLAKGDKIQSKYVWTNYSAKNNDSPWLIYGKARPMLSEFDNVPMLYLDASGNKEVIERLLNREIELEHIRVKQQENVKVYQFTNDAPFSKSSFLNGAHEKKFRQISSWLDTIETRRVGFIRYKGINSDDNFFEPLDSQIKKMNGIVGWFGNSRGVNKFENCDTLIVLGQHRLPSHALYDYSQLIFRENVFDDENSLKLHLANDNAEKALTNKVYRMKDGNHKLIEQYEYQSEDCKRTSDHFDKSETYQALHRLRLIHGLENKTVYLIQDTVLDVTVYGFLDRYKELSLDSTQAIQHLKKKKFLIDSRDSFKNSLNWNASKCTQFRRADNKGFGNWMKDHRSLNYWEFHSTDRRKHKLYSWHDQTLETVVAWLEDQGFDVKKNTLVKIDHP